MVDLALDNPNVEAMLSNFIARAIVDDVLPPSLPLHLHLRDELADTLLQVCLQLLLA